MNKQDKLILFCIGLFCVVFLIIGFFFSNGNRFYSGAYTPVVKKSMDAKQEAATEEDEESDSEQPRAAGLREREIQKHRGNGYSTF